MPITRRQFLRRLAAAGSLGLVASYPVLIERCIVLTNIYRIPVPFLPEAFRGFRIVQLTDLHYGPLVPLWLIERVVRRAVGLRPDLIVCTGDYVHEKRSARQIDTVWPVLAKLSAPHGVFSVLGNHDHWADTERSLHWMRETGQDLRHRAVKIERNGAGVWLAGAGDYWEDHRNLDLLLAAMPVGACRIVLAHNPDTADTSYDGRVDLMISGHTHGGQVDIPFIGTPVLPVQNKAYNYGLKRSPKGERVFISKGIGWAIYPVRFNCYPEIAVLELVPEPAAG